MPWLRQTAPGMLSGIPLKETFKAHVIGALGAAALRRDAARDGLRTNRRMLGVYGFEGGKRHYADLLQNWLVNACDGDLLMCHPAKDSSGDCAMSRQRRAEYEVLACPKMGEWLRTNGVRIARLDAAGTDPARHASIRLCNSQAPAEPSARRMDQTASTRVCRGQPGTGSSTS